MNFLFLLLTFIGSPVDQSSIKSYHYDVVYINIVYNKWGVPRVCQLITLDKDLNVEYYILLTDLFVKTKEGEEDYNKKRDKYAQEIEDVFERQEYRKHTKYYGDLHGGMSYPIKINGKYESYVLDGEKGLVKITADVFRLMITKNDIEMENRNIKPIEDRRGLNATTK